MHRIKRTYFVPSRIGLLLVPFHLLDNDDHPLGWYVLHEEALKVGMRFPIPHLVAHLLSTYDLSLGQINLNRWRTLLFLAVKSDELSINLNKNETIVMYYIKRNTRYRKCICVYHFISWSHFEYVRQSNKWKNTYLYARSELWGKDLFTMFGRRGIRIFSLPCPRMMMLHHFGPSRKEKIYHIKLQNFQHISYWEILTTSHFKGSRIWKY